LTLLSIENLAQVLQNEGKLAEAETLYRKNLEDRRRLLGPDHSDVLISMKDLVQILQVQNKFGEAESLLREALEIRKRTLPKDHWKIALTEGLLGDCLCALGRYSEAEPLVVGSYEKLKAAQGPLSRQVTQARDRVIKLYEAWKKLDKAAMWKAERSTK